MFNEPNTSTLPAYHIIRRRRKSIAIKVIAGTVEVHAPLRVSEREIRQLVQLRQAWIAGHLRRQQAFYADLPLRRWQHGEHVYWLGERLHLSVRSGKASRVVREQQDLCVTLGRRVSQPAQKVQQLVRQWYQQQAEQWLQDWLVSAPWQPQSARVAHFKAKWGACSRAGELSFTWKLWQAPAWVVSYVAQHELCHLRHFNHSADFWRLVAQLNPDYQNAERWLKQFGAALLNDDYLTVPDRASL